MKDKNSRNGLLYFLVVLVTIVVYLVIYMNCRSLKNSIYEENGYYENNLKRQPVNNIIAVTKKVEPTTTNKIILSSNNITTKVGKKIKITAMLVPYSSNNNKKLVWESSDPSIATVDNNGNVVALKEGEVTITVRTKNG